MSIEFSYKHHFFHHILKNSEVLFPGATRVMGIYYCKKTLGIKVVERNLEEVSINLEAEIDFANFENYRKQRPRYSWVDLQSSNPSRGENQLKIQGEYKNHCLLIRFPNSHDKLNDLLIIYFKNEEQVFRVSDKKQKLSTELKQSLASVYVRSLDVIRKQIEDDQAIHGLIQEHKANLIESEVFNIKEITTLKKKQILLIKSIIDNKANELVPGNEFIFEWDDKALSYIATNFTDLSEIDKIIKRALIIAINDADDNSNRIKVKETHVKTIDIDAKEDEQIVTTRYMRTTTLLDRYESAAAEVLKENKNLTGSNLGAALNPPITAAAISDAIRKHASKITHLLNKHPQRWSILRSSFKAIQNKLYARGSLDQMAS